MARAAIDGFEDLEHMFQKLKDPEKMAIKAVDKAAPILEKALKSEIRSASSKGYSTGALEQSIITDKAKENQYGVFSVVRPVGTDSKGVSNVDKLLWLDAGIWSKEEKGKRKHRQKALHVRDKAIKSAKAKCESIIEKTAEEWMGDV